VTSVHVLHAGYADLLVASTVTLIRDGDAMIVTDPGMVSHRALILDPLAALGVAPEDVTRVFLTHHHPDHTINVALFPRAEVVDFWARYLADKWLDHDGDGYALSPNSQLWLTPGHTAEDATLIVRADDLSRVNRAFFTANGIIGIGLFAFALADLITHGLAG